MSLSRVYRGSELPDLKPVHLVEFGSNGELLDDGRHADKEAVFEDPGWRAAEKPADAPEAKNLELLLEESYARGRRDGLQEAEAHLGQTAEALAKATEAIGRLRESLLRNSSQDMLRLVMAIARQVVDMEISANQEVVLKIIEKALQVAVRSDAYHIRVNPDDLDLVTRKKPLFLASISGLKNITFTGDPSVARGGCRVESELGDVDATLDSQLEEIRQALWNGLAGA